MAASAEGFRRSVDEALDAILQWRAGGAEDAQAGGTGKALSGTVCAEVTPGGRIGSLVIAPEAWDQPREHLVTAVLEAVNAALEQRERRWAGAVASADPETVAQRLERVQQDASARMEEFLLGLAESHVRINRRLED